MEIECTICFEKLRTVISFCQHCNISKIQCVDCILNNEKKCCFCNTEINLYKTLIETKDDELLNKTIQYITYKNNKINSEYFGDVFILVNLINDWLYSVDIEDTKTIMQQLENILISKIKYKFKNIRPILTFLKTYSTIKSLDEIPPITINNITDDNEETTDVQTPTKHFRITKKGDFYEALVNNVDNDAVSKELVFFSYLRHFTFPFLDDLYAIKNKCTCNRLSCKHCNILYCRKCLSFKHGNTDKCDIKMSVKNIKLCPMCKTIVLKDSGCDDMWCINCETFFSWKRGIIRYDNPHNPDHYNHLKNLINVDNNVVKQIVLDEILSNYSSLGSEEEIIVKALINANFRDSPPQIIKRHILPTLLQQALVIKVIEEDNLIKRDLKTVKSLIRLCRNFAHLMILLCGNVIFFTYWDYISYENINIKSSTFEIKYPIHMIELT